MSAMVKPELIAVYGSLRRGGKANILMSGCTYIAQDCLAGRLYDMGGFPAARINAAGFAPVVCDIYQLPSNVAQRAKIITKIDHYEGYFATDMKQSLFIRRRTLTIGRQSSWVWAYDYTLETDAGTLIDSGDWLVRGPVRYLADLSDKPSEVIVESTPTTSVVSGKEPINAGV